MAIGRWREDALAEAYRRHAGAVYGLARRVLGDPAVAEEVVQEVFLRLWNTPDKFDPERGSLRSFLLAQAHGRAVDMVRADTSRRQREERDARQTAESGYDIEHEVWDLALADQVKEVIVVTARRRAPGDRAGLLRRSHLSRGRSRFGDAGRYREKSDPHRAPSHAGRAFRLGYRGDVERMRGHDEVEELLGAYALDAVDADERDEIERHLAVCPRCRAELTEHREVAAVLGYAGSDAPPGLWDRIVAGLEEPPPALQLTRVVAEPATPDGPGRGADARVVPIGSARRSIGTWAFAALAVVAALVVAVLGIEVQRLNSRTDKIRSSIGIEAIQSAYKTALGNPGARRVTMTSGDGVHTVAAVILPDGTAYLSPEELPPLPSSETYQLWGVVGSDKVSLAVMGNTPHVCSSVPRATSRPWPSPPRRRAGWS